MNLIQIALTAEGFFQQQPVIQLNDAQCVRTKHAHASCDLCVEVCPTEAISLESGLPDIEIDHCIKCGVCLHTCPVGAFERADGLYNLLNCAENIVDHETLDIACIHHPAPETTDRSVDAVVQITNCLSELGPSAYVGLNAVGAKHTRVRLDACQDCPLRLLQPEIEQSVGKAQHILSAFDIPGDISTITSEPNAQKKCPLYHSENPPISRRGFLSMFVSSGASNARAIVETDDKSSTEKHTSRERQRLLNALRCLIPSEATFNEQSQLASRDFAQFTVGSGCTACGLCERVCPVGAFCVEKDDPARDEQTNATFAVTFTPHLCTNCGLCVEYCEPGSIQYAGAPLAVDVLDGAILELHSGTLRQCERCKVQFASESDDKLCPICRYRREQPSGAFIPEAALSKLPPDIRAKLEKRFAQSARHDNNESTQQE